MTTDDLLVQFSSYVSEARRLQALHKDTIHLLVGMETEFIRNEDVERVRVLRREYALDYIVG